MMANPNRFRLSAPLVDQCVILGAERVVAHYRPLIGGGLGEDLALGLGQQFSAWHDCPC
jgi:hypothetical protein